MVEKNISAECLKPELWTHLQEILDLYCPPVKILHILQKAEGFRAVTQNGEKVMLDSKSLEQPKGLLEAFPEIDEVRIYTEAAMIVSIKSCRQKRFMTGILMIIWNINIGHWKKQMEYR